MSKVKLIKSLQTVLRIIYNVKPKYNDFMSTNNVGSPNGEADRYPLHGQIYYVPHKKDESKNILYRLYNGQHHMDSGLESESGYWREGILGYPWKRDLNPPGTIQICRGYNGNNGDHTLMSKYNNQQGYQAEYFNDHFAYPRFRDEEFLELKGQKLQIKSNLNAGGIVWDLKWNNK